MKYYLAIDIGASSGRHLLCHVEQGKLVMEEIYRFANGIKESEGLLSWDMERLFSEVKKGIARCREAGKIPVSVAIDTWGLDYVLLDGDKKEILPVSCYRDERNIKAKYQIEEIIPQSELYKKTGIQKININTIYSLYADKLSGRLDRAEYMLMIPAYLSYRLTGVMKNEYTNASTTAMLNAEKKDWDSDIIEKLGLPEKLFGTLSLPGTVIGGLTDEVRAEVGFDTTVIFCASHDTASAVAGCPLCENDAYISSGTWALIGTEISEPNTSPAACEANFTNEGGVDYRFRFLKNYMGMWLFQNIRENLNKSMTYDEMMELAQRSGGFEYFDVNDDSVQAPKDMILAIRNLLSDKNAPLGFVINSVYHSLAKSFREAVQTVEGITGRDINTIRIVGGGCQDKYLNELTRDYTGKPVTAGPIEATATGNIAVQLMRDTGMSLHEVRELIRTSFDISEV